MTLILQLVQLARHIIGIIYLTTPSVAQGTQCRMKVWLVKTVFNYAVHLEGVRGSGGVIPLFFFNRPYYL
jgi:hypothetical protein